MAVVAIHQVDGADDERSSSSSSERRAWDGFHAGRFVHTGGPTSAPNRVRHWTTPAVAIPAWKVSGGLGSVVKRSSHTSRGDHHARG